ncbi:WecB/TagA/CpsF family glycosyltransferase [Spirosoma luteolum]
MLTAPSVSAQHQRASVLALRLSLGTYHAVQEALVEAARRREARSVCFANVHMTVEATQDPRFAEAVNGADWVLTDGMPLTWFINRQYGIRQERVAGIDMLPDLVRRAAETGLSVFFFGSTPEVLDQTVAVCRARHPQLTIAGTLSPPFRPLTDAEDEAMAATIRASGAQLVFVALGCPRQEYWMARMRHRIPAVLLGIGGALPILAGTVSRSPGWMQRNGLEWVYRLAMEPRRLFRRYAVTNTLFVLKAGRQLLAGRPSYPTYEP